MRAIGPGDSEAHPLSAGAGAQLDAIRAECLNRPGPRRSMSRLPARQPHSHPPAPGGHAPCLASASPCLGCATPILFPGSALSLPGPKDAASVLDTVPSEFIRSQRFQGSKFGQLPVARSWCNANFSVKETPLHTKSEEPGLAPDLWLQHLQLRESHSVFSPDPEQNDVFYQVPRLEDDCRKLRLSAT